MQKFNGSLIRQFPSLVTGNAAAGVQVSVRIGIGTALATLYATNSTAGAQIPNPITTDAKGFYSFYAVDGQYNLQYSNGFPSLEIQLLDAVQTVSDINSGAGLLGQAASAATQSINQANALISQANIELQQAIDGLVNSGFFPVAGSFTLGGTITERNQVLFNDADSIFYSWSGALPKVVSASSTPAISGGIGLTAWVNRGDAALRSALAAPDSDVIIAGQEAKDVAQWSKQVLLPEFFGAVAGEADSTAKLQAAIDAMPLGGILNGGNREYNVRSLLLKSNIELANIRLKTIAGAIDFVSPISIIGETTPIFIDGVETLDYPQGAKTNIKLYRVGVNGNRQQQTEINSPREDGGRHGLRVLGRCTNLTVEDSSFEFCGTDAVEFFSNNSLASTENIDDLCFSNITFKNTRFNSNRRHGYVFDSAFNVKMINCDAKRNGFDLDDTAPLNSGLRGARFPLLTGNLYGRPFDFEGYGIGSRIVGIQITGGDYTGNVAGALFYDFADVTDPRFQPRKDITISDALFDAVFVNPTEGIDASLTFFSTTATSELQGYDNVNISNCTFKTWLNIEGVKNLNVIGGSAKAKFADDNFYARMVKSKRWFFRGVNTDKPGIFADALPFTPVWTNLGSSPTFTSQEFTLAGFTSSGWLCKYRSNYTTAVTGSELGQISVAGCRVIPQSSCGIIAASGALFDVCAITNENNMQVPYVVTTTAAQIMEVFFEVIPITA